jgi:hypothetical protein
MLVGLEEVQAKAKTKAKTDVAEMATNARIPATPPIRSGSRSLLLLSLTRFYSHKPNILGSLPYITGTSMVSLRTIDWFVTNYARRNSTTIESSPGAPPFSVYSNYRIQLKAYTKQQFDPFRRRDRIMYYYDVDKFVETTIGQLNFFRWLVQNNVLQYVVVHLACIEQDMITTLAASPGTPGTPGKPGTAGTPGTPGTPALPDSDTTDPSHDPDQVLGAQKPRSSRVRSIGIQRSNTPHNIVSFE